MTVSEKSVRISFHNRAQLVCAGTILLLAIVPGPAAVLADEESTTVTHFMDTNTDRVPLLTAFPSYPSIARRDRIVGHATVCFMVKQDGNIRQIRLQEASHNIFKKPALRAIKKSTFEPLTPNQVLATAKTCRIYRFRLEPVLVDNQSG
jgi:TonB family protein